MVCVSVATFSLEPRGCCRYQTWICGYVQRALGTARVWSGVVQEQHVYGGGLKLYTVIITRSEVKVPFLIKAIFVEICPLYFISCTFVLKWPYKLPIMPCLAPVK